jgi:type II secretory pathway pseudopilin PulG
MKSYKCHECGFVGWADAEFCKKCGAEVVAHPEESNFQARPDRPSYQVAAPSGYQNAPAPGGSKVLAIWSLVLGIVSFLTLGLFGVMATGGIVFGVIALVKTGQNPRQHGGRGMAIAGLVLSSLSALAVPFAIVMAIAIPNLLASRRAANEGSALASLRRIQSAEATYQATRGNGHFGQLDELASEGLINPALTGPHNGYRFTIVSAPGAKGFECVGVPLTYGSSGIRSFYVDETGVIRAADRHGEEASKLDSPLEDSYSTSPYRRTSDRPAYGRD